MIVVRSNIRPNINPVAIGAPRIGETCVKINQTPKDERETRNKSSTWTEALAGGEMV